MNCCSDTEWMKCCSDTECIRASTNCCRGTECMKCCSDRMHHAWLTNTCKDVPQGHLKLSRLLYITRRAGTGCAGLQVSHSTSSEDQIGHYRSALYPTILLPLPWQQRECPLSDRSKLEPCIFEQMSCSKKFSTMLDAAPAWSFSRGSSTWPSRRPEHKPTKFKGHTEKIT